ncbi:MAG: hypothetical protein SH850_22080 [Planctomycetaceae bacterium]|nr:hypothetical protein [Planctomycetaceae bacterium]
MSLLLELQENLRDTSAAIAKHEQAMSKSRSPSLAAGLRSLQARQKQLESQFVAAAKRVGIDVCSYRIFTEDGADSLRAIALCNALEAFQNAFSVVHDATRRGPRTKASLAPETKDESEFNFGYAFSGSVGIVLTLSNEQMVLDSALDTTMDSVMGLARSQTTEDVLAQSRFLGAAAVRAMHQWATAHIAHGIGVDLKWIRGNEEKSRLMLQLPQLKALAATLFDATEDVTDTVTLRGVLVGTETETSRRFHFKTESNEDLRGAYSPSAISQARPASTPARYEATFERKLKKVMATDAELSATYYLVKLTPIT